MPHDRLSILAAIQAQGVVPVFHHTDAATVLAIVRACVAGGARAVEFTNRGDFALDVFGEVARELAREGDDAILGLGSVVEAGTAALAINRGARFIVGPGLVEEVAVTCNRRMVAYLPGCGSVSEIIRAHELGCEIVKLFPGAAVGGPDFVKAVRGPLPWAKIMPTGGVEPEAASLKAWFGAGIVAAGMGSRLIADAAVAAGDWAAIEAAVRDAVAAVRAVRATSGQG